MTDGESGESMEERAFMGRGESETEILELLRALQKTSYHAARRYAPGLTDNHTSTPPLCFYRPDALHAAQPTVSQN